MAVVAWAWHVNHSLWPSFERQDKSIAAGQLAKCFALYLPECLSAMKNSVTGSASGCGCQSTAEGCQGTVCRKVEGREWYFVGSQTIT